MAEHTDPAPSLPVIVPNAEINFFAATNFRNQNRKFGIKLDDRRRHMYVVGKTGMGKTTLLENMVLNDIYAGHGIGLVDPHGDFAEKIIDFIPANRINDVVYFNPADIEYPIGFNILETVNPEHQHLVASGLMGVFKKIWPDVWSARMEYILNNTILALLSYPGTTLLGINRLLADDEYRRRVVSNLKDPVVKAFWQTEFANYSDKFRTEAVAPIQNKIGQFLSASVIRNIVAQVKSRINIREIMDDRKIFIMNLSKGRIGEDNSRLLGGMLITKIQLAAMERVDIPEKTRKDFFLYVDEFQNFATESFANILSEARKYRLDLIMAHQYMEQLSEEVMAAVIGNVGTTVTYRVGSSDAEILAKEYAPTFVEEDLVNLPKFQIYLKLMIDGVASRPFSAQTLPPIGSTTGSTEKVVRVSRERYAIPRDKIEDKIMRWSGMMVADGEDASSMEIDSDDEMFKDIPTAAKATPATPVAAPAATAVVVPVIPVQQPKPVAAPVAPRPVQTTPPFQPVQIQPIQSAQPKNSPPRPPTPPMNGGNNQQAPGASGMTPLTGKKKKRKKKKNNNSLNPLPAGTGAPVLVGDPNQKGISLQQLAPNQPPRQEMAPRPPVAVQQAPRPSAPAPITVQPSTPASMSVSVNVEMAAAQPKENLGFIETTVQETSPKTVTTSDPFSVDYHEEAPKQSVPAALTEPVAPKVSAPLPAPTAKIDPPPALASRFVPPPAPAAPQQSSGPKTIPPDKVVRVD